MANEALCTHLDALQMEMQRLRVENARLRDEHPDKSSRINAAAELISTIAENEELCRLYEQALDDLRNEHRRQEAEGRKTVANPEC